MTLVMVQNLSQDLLVEEEEEDSQVVKDKEVSEVPVQVSEVPEAQ